MRALPEISILETTVFSIILQSNLVLVVQLNLRKVAIYLDRT